METQDLLMNVAKGADVWMMLSCMMMPVIGFLLAKVFQGNQRDRRDYEQAKRGKR